MPSSRTHIASNVAPITALAGHSKMDGQAAGQAPLCVDFTATTFGEARRTRPPSRDASIPFAAPRYGPSYRLSA